MNPCHFDAKERQEFDLAHTEQWEKHIRNCAVEVVRPAESARIVHEERQHVVPGRARVVRTTKSSVPSKLQASESSHRGVFVLGVATSQILDLDVHRADTALVGWGSHRAKRVVLSMLAAGAVAMTSAYDRALWLRSVLGDVVHGRKPQTHVGGASRVRVADHGHSMPEPLRPPGEGRESSTTSGIIPEEAIVSNVSRPSS